jgi:hypothetical protein
MRTAIQFNYNSQTKLQREIMRITTESLPCSSCLPLLTHESFWEQLNTITRDASSPAEQDEMVEALIVDVKKNTEKFNQ